MEASLAPDQMGERDLQIGRTIFRFCSGVNGPRGSCPGPAEFCRGGVEGLSADIFSSNRQPTEEEGRFVHEG
jgi:hypothetical protein